MTKKEICTNNKTFATYVLTNSSGFALKHIEYGYEDVIYFEFHGMNETTYHKSKVRFNRDGECYIMWGKYKIPLDECIRI